MTEAPILSLPDFSLPFILEIDTSGITMGVVLMLNNHPIVFSANLHLYLPQKFKTTYHSSNPNVGATNQMSKLLGYDFDIKYK